MEKSLTATTRKKGMASEILKKKWRKGGRLCSVKVTEGLNHYNSKSARGLMAPCKNKFARRSTREKHLERILKLLKKNE